MKLRKFLCALILAAFAMQALPVFADEGMWPFNNVPRAEIQRKYRFKMRHMHNKRGRSMNTIVSALCSRSSSVPE